MTLPVPGRGNGSGASAARKPSFQGQAPAVADFETRMAPLNSVLGERRTPRKGRAISLRYGLALQQPRWTATRALPPGLP